MVREVTLIKGKMFCESYQVRSAKDKTSQIIILGVSIDVQISVK